MRLVTVTVWTDSVHYGQPLALFWFIFHGDAVEQVHPRSGESLQK